MQFVLIARALRLKNEIKDDEVLCPGCGKALHTGVPIYVNDAMARDFKCHEAWKKIHIAVNFHTEVLSQPQQEQLLQPAPYGGAFSGGFRQKPLQERELEKISLAHDAGCDC